MADPDRRSTLLHAYENAAVIVSGIAAGELGRPTPCPGYDVAALIDHLVEAGRRAAALGRGQAPPPGDESPHVELSDAPGQLDPCLAWPALEGARAMIRTQYRDMVGPGVPFGAEVAPAPGADDWERLAAFTGRDPRTTPGW